MPPPASASRSVWFMLLQPLAATTPKSARITSLRLRDIFATFRLRPTEDWPRNSERGQELSSRTSLTTVTISANLAHGDSTFGLTLPAASFRMNGLHRL